MDHVHRLVDYFNKNAGAIQGATAIALLIVTLAAVVISILSIRVGRSQIRQSVLPVLTFDVVDFFHGKGEDHRDGFRIRVANVGLGPALEVEIIIDLQREEDLLSLHRTWDGSAIGAGDRVEVADIKMDASLIQLSVILQQQSASDIAQVTATYNDAYNRHGRLNGAVEFAHQVPPGNNHARFVQKSSQLPGSKGGVAPH